MFFAHDPEKCAAVFRKDHAQIRGMMRPRPVFDKQARATGAG
jgi:hypothetical protein